MQSGVRPMGWLGIHINIEDISTILWKHTSNHYQTIIEISNSKKPKKKNQGRINILYLTFRLEMEGENNNNNQDAMEVESFETVEAFIRPTETQMKQVVEDFAKDRRNRLVANDVEVATLAEKFVGDREKLGILLADYYGKQAYPYADYMTKVSQLVNAIFTFAEYSTVQ